MNKVPRGVVGVTGMRPGFPTIPKFLKSYVSGDFDYGQEVAELAAYGRGEAAITSSGETYCRFDAQLGMSHIARLKFWEAIRGALGGRSGWESAWRQAVAYDYWEMRAEAAWHLHCLEQFKRGEVPRKIDNLFLRDWGVCLGSCVALGWFDLARALARRAEVACKEGLFGDGFSMGMCCHVQYFVLKLVGDWEGRSVEVREPCAPDPVYEDLLKHWRDPDADSLTALLLSVCDARTHVARPNKNSQFFDLSQHESWYNPFEILAVLRLRENLGLSLPRVDHPLMNTPLGRLPPITEPYSDSLLISVLSTIAEELPELKLA